MLTYDIKGKNKYYSLYCNIRDDILNGRLKSGQKLPSKRALAQDLSISVITVQTAYEQLLAEGYIYSVERSGYYVANVSVDFYGRRELPPEPRSQENKFKADFVKGGAATGLFPF